MDIYEATQALLTEAVPEANVTYYLLTYDEQLDQFSLPAFPAVTYLYSNLTPYVSHDGSSGLYRASLDVEVWGTLADVSKNADLIVQGLNAQRVQVENVCFTVVAGEVRDIYDMGLDFHHRLIRFSGLVEIGEDDDSR